MTSRERRMVTSIRRLNAQYGGQGEGSLSDYLTIYRDFCRADGNLSATFATELYQKHGGECRTLLEILNRLYTNHRIS